MRFNRLTVAAAAFAVVTAGALPALSSSAAAEPSAKYRVAMKMSATKAVANEDAVVLTGKVSPAAPGTKVQIQYQYGEQGVWKKAGSAKVKKDSSYSYSFTPTSRKDYSWRVVKPGDSQATKGISKERALQVIGWVWLNSMTPSTGTGENLATIDSMPINGEKYSHTMYLPTDETQGVVEYTLGRKAYKLDATYGLSDRTATGGQGSIEVRSDGVLAFSRTFNLGESVHQVSNVTDVFRIQLTFAQVKDTPVTEPSAGAIRVLMD